MFQIHSDVISFPRESSTRCNVLFSNKERKNKNTDTIIHYILLIPFPWGRQPAKDDLHDCKNIKYIWLSVHSKFMYTSSFVLCIIVEISITCVLQKNLTNIHKVWILFFNPLFIAMNNEINRFIYIYIYIFMLIC